MAISSGFALLLAASAALNPVTAAPSSKSTLFASAHVASQLSSSSAWKLVWRDRMHFLTQILGSRIGANVIQSQSTTLLSPSPIQISLPDQYQNEARLKPPMATSPPKSTVRVHDRRFEMALPSRAWSAIGSRSVATKPSPLSEPS